MPATTIGTGGIYSDEFAAFEAADLLMAPPKSPVLFYGSSSIRLWESLEDDFPEWPLVNRGFGGSTLADCIDFFDQIAMPRSPRSMVFYAGDNDLDQGATPERVADRFRVLTEKIREAFGPIHVSFVSIKPSPSRMWNIRNIRETNRLVKRFAASRSELSFVDAFPAMLGDDGNPRPELFVEDGLHLSPAGYRIWASMLRAESPAFR